MISFTQKPNSGLVENMLYAMLDIFSREVLLLDCIDISCNLRDDSKNASSEFLLIQIIKIITVAETVKL